MNNYNKLQKYLENSGNATVILSFDTLKEILGIEVNYTAALCIKKDFHCSYVVDDVSEKRNGSVFAELKRKMMKIQQSQH